MGHKLTLCQIQKIVHEDNELMELFAKECLSAGLKSTPNGCYINGKKVGIQKFNNAKKYAAATVYDRI
jgi:hypothetical protein